MRSLLLVVALVVGLVPAVAAPAGADGFATRLAGDDRFETAVQVSRERFRDADEIDTVYLARADVFADAVAGGVLTRGPVLLVPVHGAVPDVVLEEVERLDPEDVVALGGAQAVSDQVLSDVGGPRTVARLAGDDRLSTAVEIARHQFPDRAEVAYLARADVLADAVAAGTLEGGPVLLVPPDGALPAVVADQLASSAPRQVVALGGDQAIADEVLDAAGGAAQTGRDALPETATAGADVLSRRLAGSGRIETSIAIAGAFSAGADVAYLARADVFPDAVAGGALIDGPIVLVPSCGDLPPAVAADLARLGAGRVTALGGEEAICPALLDQAAAVLVGDDDRDGDGVPDAVELRFGADPDQRDSDGDGLPDEFEILWGGAPHLPDVADSAGDGTGDAESDFDGDGLTALAELQEGTDPLRADTDGDGLDDGAELEARSDPLEPDSDTDGLDDGAEVEGGTSPINRDTDGDGTSDASEVRTATTTADEVLVELTGEGDLVDALEIAPLPMPEGADAPAGMVGAPVEFTLDVDPDGFSGPELTAATIELPYDSAAVEDPDDVALFTFDERYRTWMPTGTDLQVEDGRVRATVGGFSRYAAFDREAWAAQWEEAEPSCATRLGAADVAAADILLVIDQSNSMSTNDASDLRLEGARLLSGALLAGDRAGLVSFSSSAVVDVPATTDREVLGDALDALAEGNLRGGTDVTAAVSTGVDSLAGVRADGRPQFMVVLTDGENDPEQPDSATLAQVERAAQAGISVSTIALGGSGADLLAAMAAAGGGVFRSAAEAGELPSTFRAIDKATVGLPDTDGDGLADCEETGGMLDAAGGLTFTSDPEEVDSDGDGLSDLIEIGDGFPVSDPAVVAGTAPGTDARGFRYPVVSDPMIADSDDDDLDDAQELDEGTDARSADGDGDGIGDAEELEIQTDPLGTDTDGDGLTDTYEVGNPDAGLDPVEFDIVYSTWDYAREFTIGALCGDFCDQDNIPRLIGAIAGGFIPFIDVRDIVAGLVNGDLVGVGLSAVGLIPLVGDSVKGAANAVQFARRNADQAAPMLVAVLRRTDAPDSVKAGLVREVYGDDIDILLLGAPGGLGGGPRLAAVSDANLLRLVDSRVPLERLARVTARGVRTGSRSPLLANGNAGESALRREIGDVSGADDVIEPGPRGFADPDGPAGGRANFRIGDVVRRGADDAVDVFESKVGYVSLSSFVSRQIARDRLLIARGDVNAVEWHFYPSSRTGKVGPSEALADLLDADPLIPFVVHLPE